MKINFRKIACYYFLLNVMCFGAFYLYFPNSTQTHQFTGVEMTIDYHIILGQKITSEEEIKIQRLITSTFREVDNFYNKWNPLSEISKLNRLKAGQIVEVSVELENFLLYTDAIVRSSGGKFDPSIEPLQQLWKNHLQNNTVPSEEEINNVLPAVGWKNIHFGDGYFFKDYDQTSLDLGGIAKGYCVDLVVERLVKAGFNHVFVEWGGEIRVNGMHPDQRPWTVITSDWEENDSEHPLATMSLDNQSVATSGDYIQNWTIKKNGEEMTLFHIFDPKTAQPLAVKKSSVTSATVIAPTCVLADALATLAMMHSTLDEAKEWAEQVQKDNPEIKFYLFSREEK